MHFFAENNDCIHNSLSDENALCVLYGTESKILQNIESNVKVNDARIESLQELSNNRKKNTRLRVKRKKQPLSITDKGKN